MEVWEAQRAKYVDQMIPIELIDSPEMPERETMEEIDLADLAVNISEIGLIKPLIVKPRGDRFEVVAGHRRRLACGLCNYSPIPCRVLVGGDVDADAIKVSENAYVEPVNAIEEARFYDRLLREKCGNDCDLLCIKVRRRREYVEDRLNLLRGWPTVIEALHQKQISIAVARALNKCKDPNRLLILLDTSITQGATARQVTDWVTRGHESGPVQLADADPADQANNPSAVAPSYELKCWFCESAKYTELMEMFYLHKYCMDALKNMLNRPPAE